jgi:predicted Zn finger-like uncharacterized protein
MEAEIGDLGAGLLEASDSPRMILTCPECATSYFVDDSRIPEAGRTVKCTSCGHRWTARKDAPAPVAAEPEPEPVAEAAPEPSPEPSPEPVAAAPVDDLEFVPVDRDPEPRVRTRSARPAPAQDPRSAVTVWVGAAALIVALVAGAIAFRGQVIKLWPKSQSAYASLGLPVNSVGLVIEGVHAEPTFVGGRPVLSVTGALRNVKGEAVTSPPLRINLLNRLGKPIAAKVVRPVDPRVPAGATRHFAIAISDPPANARDLEVVFEAAPQHAATSPAAASVAAPPPAEAAPLPANSPEALSEHG